ncbi:MAG: DUF5107 domain-containing protein [Treponema sp.]|jgi:tetratricopeptide (TPR) repeat protein|nr:DUF5107 domain-containing protein [Treponema sp.]
MGSSVIRNKKIKLIGSPLCAKSDNVFTENPQPFFRRSDLAVAAGPNFPCDKKCSFGRETGFRLLPYTMQDRYNRELVDMEFTTVVMENNFLRAEFIPALGGRMWSLFDKKRNREVLYKNPVFRPANLAIRDAWFSGGIEWNIGRLGHAAHTCSPVFAGVFESQGLSILRLWEFERQSRLFWRVEFTLPEDSPALFSYVKIENIDDYDKPLYWWTNAALKQTPGVRVLSASDEVIYIVPCAGNITSGYVKNNQVKTMDYGCLPKLPVLPGKDASYPSLFCHSNEYFFQNDISLGGTDCDNRNCVNLPWEAAVYEDGFAFAEKSSFPLLYRKMFCWGQGRGGRRWQEFLSMPGQEYFEVQAGLSPTQLHTSDIAAGQTVEWVQAFTSIDADDQAHQANYNAASAYVAGILDRQISNEAVTAALEHGRNRSGVEALIISMGSGWGSLEINIKKRMPSGLSFPEESVGEEQVQWVHLLKKNALPARSPDAGPGSFVTGKEWEYLLGASTPREKDWLTPYHLGVIYFEQGDAKKAVISWKESVKRQKNAWAYRNLALAAARLNDMQSALEYYRRCMFFDGDLSFAEEYIPLLLACGKESQAASELDACIKKAGSLETLPVPLLEAAARIALERKDNSLLDRIFALEQAHLREGDTALVEIWLEREIRGLCGAGKQRAEAQKQVQKALHEGVLVPPKGIDFRMF